MHEERKFELQIKLSNKVFGIFLTLIFAAIFIYPYVFYELPVLRVWAIIASLILLSITIIKSNILEPFKNLWLKLTKYISHFLSLLVMFIIFVSTVLPIAIIMKIFRYDALKLSINNKLDTYWMKKDPKDVLSIKDQF
tara:strand:+ start:489 stop:902 length:414 start_codon:yes stop_codon:yes gene_type:complete